MYLGRVDFSGSETSDEPTTHSLLTLPAARMMAARVHRERAQGRDPLAEQALGESVADDPSLPGCPVFLNRGDCQSLGHEKLSSEYGVHAGYTPRAVIWC